MGDLAIEVNDVSKYYKLYRSPGDRLKEALSLSGKQYHQDFYALSNINLEIKKGEILGIVGTNGSGKSTLLKLIAGVLVPSSGKITVHGKVSALLELGSGFNPEFTGIENVFFHGSILGYSREEMDLKLDAILDFVDIGDFIFQPLKSYSSGMRARLGFAVAVNIDTEILILDEVLAVGDDLFKRKCYAKMEEFFSAGKTIIYVSHNINSVNQLCTRAIFIDAGDLLMDSPAKLVTSYYQKYILSTENNKGKVRREILALQEHANPKGKEVNTYKKEEVNGECFLPEMVSSTMVKQRNHDGFINDAQLLSQSGDKVNILVYGRSYLLSYQIVFEHSVGCARTSFAIHDQRGVLISSASMLDEDLLYPDENSSYDISWGFSCKLLPGTYYINVDVVSLNNDGSEGEILNRIVDVIVFKVIDDGLSRIGGLVGLDQLIKVSRAA